jgi:hypothetical protein
MHVEEAIEVHGGKRGSVEVALLEVAKRDGVSYDHVRDIHYDRDPEWRRIVAVELDRRKVDKVVTAEEGTRYWENWFTGCQ